LHEFSSSSSRVFGFSGSKSFSIIRDLNLLLRPLFDLIFLSPTEFSKLSLDVAVLVLIFAERFNLCAFPFALICPSKN